MIALSKNADRQARLELFRPLARMKEIIKEYNDLANDLCLT